MSHLDKKLITEVVKWLLLCVTLVVIFALAIHFPGEAKVSFNLKEQKFEIHTKPEIPVNDTLPR